MVVNMWANGRMESSTGEEHSLQLTGNRERESGTMERGSGGLMKTWKAVILRWKQGILGEGRAISHNLDTINRKMTIEKEMKRKETDIMIDFRFV